MRRTFIEMGLNLLDLTPVHDMFHGVIPGQVSTPIGRIDLNVSYGTGENKHREMLTFEVASFDIGYNYILGRPFLLKFMAVIHTAYATVKMPGPREVITLKSDQRDVLACESTTLTHAGRFNKEVAQKLAAKVAKMHGGGTPRECGDAWTISRGHIQNAYRKAEAGHDGYPCTNPAHHRSAGGR
jgi:hypothetical protein